MATASLFLIVKWILFMGLFLRYLIVLFLGVCGKILGILLTDSNDSGFSIRINVSGLYCVFAL